MKPTCGSAPLSTSKLVEWFVLAPSHDAPNTHFFPFNSSTPLVEQGWTTKVRAMQPPVRRAITNEKFKPIKSMPDHISSVGWESFFELHNCCRSKIAGQSVQKTMERTRSRRVYWSGLVWCGVCPGLDEKFFIETDRHSKKEGKSCTRCFKLWKLWEN